MALYSSILAWRIPWTEEPGGLQSIVLHRVQHCTQLNTTEVTEHAFTHSCVSLITLLPKYYCPGLCNVGTSGDFPFFPHQCTVLEMIKHSPVLHFIFFFSALSFSGGIVSSCRHNWLLVEKITTCRPTSTVYNDQTKVLTVIKVSFILDYFPPQSETCGGL